MYRNNNSGGNKTIRSPGEQIDGAVFKKWYQNTIVPVPFQRSTIFVRGFFEDSRRNIHQIH
ncbi:MAG TPA: hypothetical protein VK711_07710, partial [Puia sp.]|nr:hypothetical protein [Puia sp.]